MDTARRDVRIAPWIGALVIVAWGAWRLLPGIDHPMIMGWDESVHQAAARGVYDTPFYPHVYAERLYPAGPSEWLKAEVWLHKPTLPFWLGALTMTITGVTPGALRLISVFAAIGTALGIAWIVRRFGGPTERMYTWLGVVAGMLFLSLPFGWDIVQGYQFGDVTDATLAFSITSSFVCLIKSVETKTLKWALFAGIATGLGYLCKSALALPALGACWAMWGLTVMGAIKGPRFTQALTMTISAMIVALPWNLYTRFKWPVVYRTEAEHTLDHLRGKVTNWNRPFDAIFAEINGWQFQPASIVLPVLGGAWLLWRAGKRRDVPSVAMALWLWATWIVLSISPAKVPATTWGAAPIVVGAIALLAYEAIESRAWAAVISAGIATPWIIEHVKKLSVLREKLPISFEVTRAHAGLVEGLAIAFAAALVAIIFAWPLRRTKFLRVLGVCVTVLSLGYLLGKSTLAQHERQEQQSEVGPLSYVAEVGRVIDRETPRRSVVFLSQTHDPQFSFEHLSLMFYSGRPAYMRSPDIMTAHRHRMHPYLVSSIAEPYADLANVPPYAWMRAYDLDRPQALAEIPRTATRVSPTLAETHVLAYAVGPLDASHDRWAFYIDNQSNPPARFSIGFVTSARTIVEQIDVNTAVLTGRSTRSPWYILPVVGPRRADTIAVELDAAGHRIELHR